MSVLFWLLLLVLESNGQTNNQDNIKINQEMIYENVVVTGQDNIYITAEVADSLNKRMIGLSNRSDLISDAGMLFIFEDQQEHSFWMKDMSFPIDIIWLDANKKVVWIEENIDPESYPTIYSSKQAAKYVLEINAGQTDELNIKLGDSLDW